MAKLIFYHGTSKENAEKILKEGFRTDQKTNWEVKSKKGFVYLSLAYAPFYAMNATEGNELALIKVEVDEQDCYPEDDFIMSALGKPVYTQEEIDSLDLESLKKFYRESIQYMGNVAVKPDKIKIIGVRFFDGSKLLLKHDPTISQKNYAFLGKYYKDFCDWIYDGNDLMIFKDIFQAG